MKTIPEKELRILTRKGHAEKVERFVRQKKDNAKENIEDKQLQIARMMLEIIEKSGEKTDNMAILTHKMGDAFLKAIEKINEQKAYQPEKKVKEWDLKAVEWNKQGNITRVKLKAIG
ncbi:MAG: hypothetical protein SWO11_21805 [Thermodesulfobacteriota bacterium]|nr:hypothetical protein [Thermodesulfobacteriota bacterium]